MKILVIGDSCTDVFVYGDCYRLNPEAPTPVLKEKYRQTYSGMAANVAKNVEALGFTCDFITQKEEIIKTRYVDEKSNYILLRIDNDNPVTPIFAPNILNYSIYDLVIIADYNKGFLAERDLQLIFTKSKLSFIDTKKTVGEWIKGVSFIKINEIEYNNSSDHLDFMFGKNNNKLIVTMGELGATHQQKLYKPKYKVDVRDVVGAGDTFLAAVSCHYLLNKDIIKAIEFANICAGEVVSQKGTAFPKQKLIKKEE